MGLLGNFVGQALGMQSAEEYTQSVEAADRLQRLQRANRARKNQLEYGVDKTQRDGTAGVTPFNPDDAFSFDNLEQPGLRNVPPATAPADDLTGLDQRGPKRTDTITVPKTDSQGNVVIQTEDGSLPDAPVTDLTDPFGIEGNNLLPDSGPAVPPLPTYRRNQDNTERNAEIAKRNQLQESMSEIMLGGGVKRKGGQGTQNVTREQGEAYKWWTSEEAFRLFYNNPSLLDVARNNPVEFAQKYTQQKGQRTTSKVVPESAARTEKLITGRIEGLKTEISGNKVQNVYKLANEFGIDPFAAIAIFGIESDFGRVKKDSNRGAKGGMQVMPAQFNRLKKWFADPANREAIESAFTLPDGTVNQARVDYAIQQFSKMKMPNARGQGGTGNAEIVSGLAQLVYNKAIGLPKNLWGAGYQGNANQVLQLGRPLNADDGNISNSDYNRAYVTLYNHIYKTYGLALSEVQTPYGIDLNTIKGSGVGAPAMTTVEAPTTTTAPTPRDSSGISVQTPAGGLPTVFFNGQPLEKFNTQEEADAFAAQLQSGDVSAVPMPNLADADKDTGGVSAVDMPNLADKDAAPTVEVDGKEEPSVATPDVDPDITKFLRNPPNIGIETQNLLDQRKLAVDALNRQLSLVNEEIMRNNQKVAEYERMAQVARISGDLDGYERYRGLADGINSKSNAIREQAIIAQDTARATMLDFDNKLLLVQGAQALQDLSYGSTARAGAVLSAYSGMDIQVVPRSDGNFDIVVAGDRQATYTYDQLVDKLQSTYSAAYRENKAKAAEKRQTYLFEKGVDLQVELTKQRDKLLGELKKENLKNAADIYLEELKQRKGEFKALGEGYALIYDQGQYYLLQPEAVEETINGEKVLRPKLTPLSPMQATALNAGGATAEDYKAASE